MGLGSRFVHAAAALLVAGSTAAVAAPVTVDASPTGLYFTTWSNNAAGQNFLVQFSLAETTELTGFDLFTFGSATIGTAVTVRIRTDAAGDPAAANLFEFDDVIDSTAGFDANSVVASIGLSGVTLSAGTYWIGVSGTTQELGWSSYDNGGGSAPDDQRQLSGNAVQFTPNIYDLAYRIHGETAGGHTVPEPSGALLAGLAIAALAVARRRRPA